jgi:pyruvate dehydrogenase E2 component (dihydrolipoamide acetyltransferase)
MSDIVMPKLSDTMTEGRLVSWKKQVGELVRRGDVLAEVETDKANMELEAFTSGVLLEIRVPAGQPAEVGTVIAVIGTPEEKSAPAAQPKEAAEGTPAPVAAKAPEAGSEVRPETAVAEPASEPTPARAQGAKPQPGSVEATATEADAPSKEQGPVGEQASAEGEGPGEKTALHEAQAPTPAQAPPAAGQVPEESQTPASAPAAPSGPSGTETGAAGPVGFAAGAHEERAAPVVRRRARELGIDLGQLKGSGPEGRILLQDLEGRQGQPAAAPASTAPTAQSAPGAPAAPGGGVPGKEETVPLSRLRSAIARTVAESWRTIPHFSVSAEVVMDETEEARRQLKGAGLAVTLNDLIVKGVALALAKFPRLNASFAAEAIRIHSQVNIGVAVGVPDGVLVPVIADCQLLSLQQIALAARHLVDLARSGGLSEQQMSGGTFSVSNLGMYGVSQFSAIIYPTQAAVLAIGAVSDAVLARAGVPVCVRLMKLTLSADHRIVDGAYAAQFLAELKNILENPVRLFI